MLNLEFTEEDRVLYSSYRKKAKHKMLDAVTADERAAMAKHMAMTRQAKPVNYCIISWRNGAKRRGIEWQLTDEFLITLAAETTVCPILGIPLVYDCHTGAGAGKTNPNRASLDRVDSSKGYTPDNVRIVSWAFNNLKNTFTDEQLYAYCKAFVNYMENR